MMNIVYDMRITQFDSAFVTINCNFTAPTRQELIKPFRLFRNERQIDKTVLVYKKLI